MVSAERRFSVRLRELPKNKKPAYYAPSPSPSRKRSHRTRVHVNCKEKGEVVEVSGSNSKILDSNVTPTNVDGRTNSSNADGKSAYARVKETMKLFDRLYLQAVQEEDNRCSAEANEVKPEKGGARNDDKKQRPDLKAMKGMESMNAVLYPKKQTGYLPGIDVGYQFYSRAAMVVLGFHSHWLSGIDYIGKSSRDKELKGLKLPLAVAIVLSGQYEDDQDNKEDIIYTGQGGNDLLGRKHQVKDQEMSRGNLALKNNIEQSLPVRVVRGHRYGGGQYKKVYTYDGLYKVVEWWPCKGLSGYNVFKYRLRRVPGQPELTTNQVHFINGSASNISPTNRVVWEDISGGQERIPIRVINEIDDTPLPSGFVYSMSNQIAENVKLPPNAHGCKCKGSCTNRNTCSCARLNGSDFPYVRRDGGRLIEPKDVVFECGPNCSCGPECFNRISQQGLKYKLEIFRTPNKGWAVRTLEFVPSGALVCEYTGLVRRTDELDNVTVNDYILEIDCLQTMNGIGRREKRLGDVSASMINTFGKDCAKAIQDQPEFCIDASSTGNVSRFINHSCEPNLFVQCVLSTHQDPRLARVLLVASENIPPFQELTYDYNYELDSVVIAGNILKLPCHCGAADCRKRLY